MLPDPPDPFPSELLDYAAALAAEITRDTARVAELDRLVAGSKIKAQMRERVPSVITPALFDFDVHFWRTERDTLRGRIERMAEARADLLALARRIKPTDEVGE